MTKVEEQECKCQETVLKYLQLFWVTIEWVLRDLSFYFEKIVLIGSVFNFLFKKLLPKSQLILDFELFIFWNVQNQLFFRKAGTVI